MHPQNSVKSFPIHRLDETPTNNTKPSASGHNTFDTKVCRNFQYMIPRLHSPNLQPCSPCCPDITSMRTKLYVALLAVALTTCGCTETTNTATPDSSNTEPAHAHNESDVTIAENSDPGATTSVPTEEIPNHTPTPENSIHPAETVRMIAWNVESGGNDPDVISNQLAEFQGCDVICLSEVNDANFERYASALQDKYYECHGQSGRSDRLQIFVKRDRYDVLEQQELSQHREHVLNKGNHRSPLYVRIKDRTSGAEMLVMTNHLARGNAQFRQEQAVGLREWPATKIFRSSRSEISTWITTTAR